MMMERIRVLLVEDNPGDARLIQEIFAEAKDGQFQLEQAETLAGGLDRLARGEIDVVLLDLQLPDSFGIHTLEQVRDRLPNTPVVVLTAKGDEQLGMEAMKRGAQDYLFKGEIQSQWLMRALRYAIERHRMVLELELEAMQLRASEVRFRRLIEQGVDGILIVDNHRHVRFANAAAEKVLGREAAQLVGAPVEFPIVAGGRSEVEVVREGERKGVVEIRWSKTEWEGQVVHLAALRDMTERARAEEALRRWAHIFEYSGWGVVITSSDGRAFQTMNPAFAKMHGYGIQELAGRPCADIVAPDHRKTETEAMRLACQSGRHVFESWHRRKDESVFPVLVDVTTVEDHLGIPLYCVLNVQDITERKHAEEALRRAHGQLERRVRERTAELRESEERYALALQGANDGIWDWSLKSDEIYFSLRWKTMLGYDEPEIGISPEEWFSRVHPEDLGRLKSEIREHLDGRAPHLESEHRMLHKDGTYRWTLCRGLAIRDEEAKAYRMAGSQTDITQRKQLNMMKDEFISTVSHELRTPLTSIHGSLKLIAGGVVGEIPARAQALVDVACVNSERLSRLVDNVLDIAKIESGGMVLDARPMDIMSLVEQASQENFLFAAQFGVTLHIDRRLPGVRVRADADRLVQVMTNLLSNAVKFSPPNAMVTVSVVRCDHGVRVAVTDRGPGIRDEFRKRIFEKFAQADASDSRQRGGTGLGLTITKAIVEQLGGTIGFKSEPNVATTFYFDLPECTDQPTETPAHRQGASS